MIRHHNTIVIVTALAVSAGIWIMSLSKDNIKKQNHLSAKVFEGSCGWGYDILVNDTLFIRQESVPVLETKKGFDKKEQAEKAAALILQKLQQTRLPTLTTFDLQQIFSTDK